MVNTNFGLPKSVFTNRSSSADSFLPMGLLKVHSTANCICHVWRKGKQLDMLIILVLNVLHCAHFEQWAKYLANPTDSVEKIPQQVSPSCNEVGNSSSKHVGRVGNRLWRSALSKKLFGSRKTTTSRDWQWFLLGNQACSSICGVQQHRYS